jgi:hypothetical protein
LEDEWPINLPLYLLFKDSEEDDDEGDDYGEFL